MIARYILTHARKLIVAAVLAILAASREIEGWRESRENILSVPGFLSVPFFKFRLIFDRTCWLIPLH